MKIYKIQRIDAPDENMSVSKLKFADSAKFYNEVLPSLFKSREFIGGSVVWLESGYMCKGVLNGSNLHPLDVPIAICNSGFDLDIAESVLKLIFEDLMIVRNYKGEKFKISVESCSDENDSINDNTSSEREGKFLSYVATPIIMSNDSLDESMLANVEGYIPSSVKDL